MNIIVPIFQVRKRCLNPPLTSFTFCRSPSPGQSSFTWSLFQVGELFQCFLESLVAPILSFPVAPILITLHSSWHHCKLKMFKPLELVFPHKLPLHLNCCLLRVQCPRLRDNTTCISPKKLYSKHATTFSLHLPPLIMVLPAKALLIYFF